VKGKIVAPKLSGKCRVCGCTELQPCVAQLAPGQPLITCCWLDPGRTLCSNFRCVGRVPMDQLIELMKDAA
jgi:hypothetical protein